jgi:hypothetical protein
VNRHRFVGMMGQACTEQVRGFGGGTMNCGLHYAASFHYNDHDHPFCESASDPDGLCLWVLQNVAPGVGAVRCYREAGDAVHRAPVPDDAETVVMKMGSSADAPAEDGPGELQSPYGLSVAVEPSPEPGPAARAAWAIRNADVVVSGPWPVRQWFCGDGGAPEWWENPQELLCALNVAGEPFTVEVWWAAVDRRMVRVTWGSLLGLPEGELSDSVESWVS